MRIGGGRRVPSRAPSRSDGGRVLAIRVTGIVACALASLLVVCISASCRRPESDPSFDMHTRAQVRVPGWVADAEAAEAVVERLSPAAIAGVEQSAVTAYRSGRDQVTGSDLVLIAVRADAKAMQTIGSRVRGNYEHASPVRRFEDLGGTSVEFRSYRLGGSVAVFATARPQEEVLLVAYSLLGDADAVELAMEAALAAGTS